MNKRISTPEKGVQAFGSLVRPNRHTHLDSRYQLSPRSEVARVDGTGPESREPFWICRSRSPPPAPDGLATMRPITTLEPGDTAPAFTLLDQTGAEVKLSAFKGRKVLVYFGRLNARALSRRAIPSQSRGTVLLLLRR